VYRPDFDQSFDGQFQALMNQGLSVDACAWADPNATTTSEDLPLVGLIIMTPVNDAAFATMKSRILAGGAAADASPLDVGQDAVRMAKPATGAYLALARVGDRGLMMFNNLGKGFDPGRADEFLLYLAGRLAALSA
jgi:hypothetical protein